MQTRNWRGRKSSFRYRNWSGKRLIFSTLATAGCNCSYPLEILLERFGPRRSLRRVDVDLDTTGLTVTGSQYELARKGYFPRRRGNRGYQLNAAMASETSETLALSLDPSNIPLGERLVDMPYAVMEVVGPGRMGMIRADPAHGTIENLLLLLDLGLDLPSRAGPAHGQEPGPRYPRLPLGDRRRWSRGRRRDSLVP